MFFFNFQEILNLGRIFVSWFPYISVTCLLLWSVIPSLVFTLFYFFLNVYFTFPWIYWFWHRKLNFYFSTQNNYYFSKKLLLFKTVVFYYFSSSFKLLLPDFCMSSILSLSLWLWSSCFYRDKSLFGAKFM